MVVTAFPARAFFFIGSRCANHCVREGGATGAEAGGAVTARVGCAGGGAADEASSGAGDALAEGWGSGGDGA